MADHADGSRSLASDLAHQKVAMPLPEIPQPLLEAAWPFLLTALLPCRLNRECSMTGNALALSHFHAHLTRRHSLTLPSKTVSMEMLSIPTYTKFTKRSALTIRSAVGWPSVLVSSVGSRKMPDRSHSMDAFNQFKIKVLLNIGIYNLSGTDPSGSW